VSKQTEDILNLVGFAVFHPAEYYQILDNTVFYIVQWQFESRKTKHKAFLIQVAKVRIYTCINTLRQSILYQLA
jgi:hypothetical protein